MPRLRKSLFILGEDSDRVKTSDLPRTEDHDRITIVLLPIDGFNFIYDDWKRGKPQTQGGRV